MNTKKPSKFDAVFSDFKIQNFSFLQQNFLQNNSLIRELLALKIYIRPDRFWFEQDQWLLIKMTYRVLRQYQIF